MNILITGGTGLVGSHFIQRYGDDHSITVLTRHPKNARKKLGPTVSLLASLGELENLNHFDAVINLAGEPIAEKRWTDAQRERIEQSRWHITESLVGLFAASETPPHTFISGSAIGYYGRQGTTPVTEAEHTPNDEFSHRLCKQWETIALRAESSKTRVCLLRTGIVLSRNGGALKKMLLPFRLGLGGPMGDGKQMMSWIHIHDMTAGIMFLLEHPECSGPYNFTAPKPVNNETFSKTLGKSLHRPAFFRAPAFVLRLAFGEMSDLMLTGQAVLPERLEQAGYTFEYGELKEALDACV
ncbi:TIGR01777 family oxidoreductase [Aliidiomarina indica]|uniref:TIGR01777 family oxidoreductase n=1 Tax=Aliidiomarina indica TaxID=2749147 RepID=UPI00188E4726|nr:TIGR01777 family oxidoreductase [Aliidiomarina indica]